MDSGRVDPITDEAYDAVVGKVFHGGDRCYDSRAVQVVGRTAHFVACRPVPMIPIETGFPSQNANRIDWNWVDDHPVPARKPSGTVCYALHTRTYGSGYYLAKGKGTMEQCFVEVTDRGKVYSYATYD